MSSGGRPSCLVLMCWIGRASCGLVWVTWRWAHKKYLLWPLWMREVSSDYFAPLPILVIILWCSMSQGIRRVRCRYGTVSWRMSPSPVRSPWRLRHVSTTTPNARPSTKSLTWPRMMPAMCFVHGGHAWWNQALSFSRNLGITPLIEAWRYYGLSGIPTVCYVYHQYGAMSPSSSPVPILTGKTGIISWKL